MISQPCISYMPSMLNKQISNGDIQSMELTHRSRVSGIVHPGSSYAAAAQDAQDGLARERVWPVAEAGAAKKTPF